MPASLIEDHENENELGSGPAAPEHEHQGVVFQSVAHHVE